MIAYLEGRLAEIWGNACLIVTEGGVGYEVALPAHTLAALPGRGEHLTLYTSLAERGRTWEDVLSHYQTFVKPMHQQFIEPTKRCADIILPEGSSPVVVDILASRIRMSLKNSK